MSTAPYPGQPPMIGMAKPGNVTGIQVILWIFSAISAIGDLFSVIGLVNYFSFLGVLMLLVALYFTVQSLISPIHIERGKRWAWIWSVVSAAIGIGFSLISMVFSLQVSQFFGGSFLLSFALGVLYTVLLCLLLSPSAKAWILMHRIQRGEVPANTVLDSRASTAPAAAPAQRPARRPGAVTAAQVLLALLVVPVALVLPELVEEFQYEADMWEYESLSAYLDEYNYRPLLIAAGIGVLVVLVVHAFLIWGLGRGRRWARIFGAIWLGVMALPLGIGALTMGLLIQQRGERRAEADVPYEPVWLPVSFWALLIGVGMLIAAFVLLSSRGSREWTPGKPPTFVVIHQQY